MSRPMTSRILWIMRSPVFVRNFDAVLRELAERGHLVHVAFEGDKDGQDDQRTLIVALVASHPEITLGEAPVPRRPRSVLGARMRGTADYLRYLEPRYDGASALRDRARGYAVWGIAAAEPALRRSARLRQTIAAGAGALARLVRTPRAMTRFLTSQRADVLLVAPLTHFGSPQPDYLRAARRLGLPSALMLFSWDNLTNKGLMHEIPDRVLVWNAEQAREAGAHHGVPPERVDVTGAAAYDHWFGWRPSRDRDRFFVELELDPARPCILYLCSSGFIAAHEPAWIVEWLEALRGTTGPLAHVNVVVRPHPLNSEGWRSGPLAARPGVRVFPPLGEDPRSEAARQSYFDSIHHAALVVGINTSALIESAIVGRRSFTVRDARFSGTQDGTLHFRQLLEANGGPLRVAGSMSEHLGQLAAGLEPTPEDREQLRRFVHRFVRPLGLDREVAPIVADRIEALARAGRSPRLPRH